MNVDTEEKRFIDCIKAIAFKKARDAGASFITRSWVAAQLGRSETFVKDNWNKDPHNCKQDVSTRGRVSVIDDLASNHIESNLGRQRKSCRVLAKEVVTASGDSISHMSIHRYFKKNKIKPFHVIRKPLKTQLQRDNQLWFCDYL